MAWAAKKMGQFSRASAALLPVGYPWSLPTLPLSDNDQPVPSGATGIEPEVGKMPGGGWHVLVLLK